MDIEQIRKQAQNENTPPEILKFLAIIGYKDIRRYVAGNPNTPVKVLEKLGEEFPDAIVENPIFDLLLLENPESKFVLLSLARASTTSIGKLKELANHQDRDIKEAVVINNKTPANIIEHIFTKDIWIKKSVAENPNASEKLLYNLAKENNYDVLYAISQREFLSEKILKILIQCDCRAKKFYPNHRPENYSWRIRQELASNLDIKTGILNNLIKDEHHHVRAAIAAREDILEEQAMILAHDLSGLVRKRLVDNPNVSNAVKKLLNISNKPRPYFYYLNTSLITKKTIDKLKSDRNISVREIVAISNNISIEIAEELANDSVALIRRAIAANTKTPASILDKLKSDRSLTVRRAVAENPNSAIDTLKELLNDEAPKVIESAKDNLSKRLNRKININFMNIEEKKKIISASLLRLRMRSPFFATLALFAKFISTQNIPTAATDGKDIFYNPDFLQSLTTPQQDGLLLHEVLHAALLHVMRRGVRDREKWNIAADIVVNGIICQQGCFELPEGVIRDRNLEHLSVEEIYELLPQQDSSYCLGICDLYDDAPTGNSNGGLGNKFDSLSEAKKAELESHWRNAMQQAAVIARTTNQGKLPAGIERELGTLERSQLDWRSYLWRYLVKTPTDYTEFDRRFIGRGLYLETLQGESVEVYVAVDTSGSIDAKLLKMFLSEVNGILNSYPHLECELYYADADIYGAYELNPDSDIPQPKGGGGTSFVPFFNKIGQHWDGMTTAVCVYLTDGYGTFPDTAPELPVLWVVTPGGLDLSQFPFGETVRLLSQ